LETRRIALKLSYDGTRYAGWQRQHNALSVQQVVEGALYRLLGEAVAVTGASRTDAGVHARGQMVHFDTAASVPPDRYAYALNPFLPPDVRVMASAAVPGDFHARFMARGKTYRYHIDNAPHADALTANRAWHVFHPLDMAAIQGAADALMGTHDFTAFAAAGGTHKTARRTVTQARWSRQDNLLTFEIAGNAFLYNMVRIIVGTLVYVGMGKIPPETIAHMLATHRRTDGGPTAPPQGLVLWAVRYNPDLPLFC